MKVNFEIEFTPKVHPYPGDYTVVDGPDGSGKSAIIKGFLAEAKAHGIVKDESSVFSCDDYEIKNHIHPDFNRPTLKGNSNPTFVDLTKYSVVTGSEPCYAMSATRGEVIADFDAEFLKEHKSRKYSPLDTVEHYSSNRRIKLGRVVMPALKDGRLVFMSRSLSATLWYQTVQARMEGIDFGYNQIFSAAGNRFAAEHLPNRLVVPVGINAEQLIERLDGRTEKDDHCKFENTEFQLNVINQINSDEGKKFFEDAGVEVIMLDTSGTVEQTIERAREIFREKILPYVKWDLLNITRNE